MEKGARTKKIGIQRIPKFYSRRHFLFSESVLRSWRCWGRNKDRCRGSKAQGAGWWHWGARIRWRWRYRRSRCWGYRRCRCRRGRWRYRRCRSRCRSWRRRSRTAAVHTTIMPSSAASPHSHTTHSRLGAGHNRQRSNNDCGLGSFPVHWFSSRDCAVAPHFRRTAATQTGKPAATIPQIYLSAIKTILTGVRKCPAPPREDCQVSDTAS